MTKTKTYYLYRHIRLDKNEPFYIGIGTLKKTGIKLSNRYKRAYSHSKRNTHWKSIVALSEYDVEIIFETASLDEIKQKEVEFIALYGRHDKGKGPLANQTDGGDGRFGRIVTEEEKAWRRELMSGRKPTKETLAKRSLALRGRIISEEHRKKLSDSHKGQPAWNKGRPLSDEEKAKNRRGQPGSKQIIQKDGEGRVIKVWESIRLAAAELGIVRANMCKCIRGKAKSAGGFKWELVNGK